MKLLKQNIDMKLKPKYRNANLAPVRKMPTRDEDNEESAFEKELEETWKNLEAAALEMEEAGEKAAAALEMKWGRTNKPIERRANDGSWSSLKSWRKEETDGENTAEPSGRKESLS